MYEQLGVAQGVERKCLSWYYREGKRDLDPQEKAKKLEKKSKILGVALNEL